MIGWTRRRMLRALPATLVGGMGMSGPLAAEGATTSLRALTIGVDGYDNLRDLTRATGDARAVADRIEHYGYSVIRCIDPTLARMEADFANFLAGVTPDSSVLLFFAGHGFEVAGANYLTARDTTDRLEGFFDSVVPVGALLDRIAAKGPRQAFIILDACRDNPLPSGTLGQGRGFVSAAAPGGFYIAYSAGSGETALDDLGEDDRCGNGLFTRALLDRMNRVESFDSIVNATRATVTALATSVGHSQHPGIYDQTQHRLTIDGRGSGAEGRAPVAAGQMRSTAALLIATPATDYLQLSAPTRDVELVGKALAGLGARVSTLSSPSQADVRAALTVLAASPEDNLIVHLAGPAIYIEPGDARPSDLLYLFRDSMADEKTVRGDALSLNALYAMLRKPKRTVTILSDCGVWAVRGVSFAGAAQAAADGGRTSRGHANVAGNCGIRVGRLSILDELYGDGLAVEREGPAHDQRLGDLAVLFSSSIGRPAADQAVGLPHGPFAIAVGNALARPGLSIKDFARVVRDEVEDITDARQIPQLVATPSGRKRVLALPRTISADDPAARCVPA